jgi:hypothetical protein
MTGPGARAQHSPFDSPANLHIDSAELIDAANGHHRTGG